MGLGDAYGATLDRIKAQGGEKARLGMAALMWISYSERPLEADELCYALAVEIGSPNFDAGNIPSTGTLLACCQGLVAVEKDTSTVRLIHFTVQEYLRARPEPFSSAHSAMAEACLSYLNSQQVKALSTCSVSDLQSTPFLAYSSLYWGIHAKKELSDCAKSLALKLFDDCNNHISIELLLEVQELYGGRIDYDNLSLFSGLHCASLFGIVEIVAALVEVGGCDINQVDCVGNTPLWWAAQNGHEGVVEVLLGRDEIDPNKPGVFGQTPLCCAVGAGHEGVVKILLQRDDVNPNVSDSGYDTPLTYAAESGHEGIVKTLLRRDSIDPERSNRAWRAPLFYAAMHGREGVVKMLLEQGDTSPDRQDLLGRTPFSWAAEGGHEGVAKILLWRDDVNPDTPDTLGRTPLWYACQQGHPGMVKILLGRDEVNPDAPDTSGRTPLSWAAGVGAREVGARQWSKYYSDKMRSTPTSRTH